MGVLTSNPDSTNIFVGVLSLWHIFQPDPEATYQLNFDCMGTTNQNSFGIYLYTMISDEQGGYLLAGEFQEYDRMDHIVAPDYQEIVYGGEWRSYSFTIPGSIIDTPHENALGFMLGGIGSPSLVQTYLDNVTLVRMDVVTMEKASWGAVKSLFR